MHHLRKPPALLLFGLVAAILIPIQAVIVTARSFPTTFLHRSAVLTVLLMPLGIFGALSKEATLDPTPSMERFKSAFSGFWRGGVGGILGGVGMALLGAPVGTATGALVAAAVVGGDVGKTIAVIGGFEAAQSLFINGAEA